ncbi:hypothetical protein APY04_0558 [Hyphomicrobium sulfonivorans]|uniref:Uncharacterized protein n=2 Tax=Hyphomicrobium sulfonivorans TaxID=121290 RepID=A0A109BLA8_HYPSL|nr:hypothetical protein APY04_0558 [Hyphomicrobium sulfonivorans]
MSMTDTSSVAGNSNASDAVSGEEDISEERFLALVDELRAATPSLSPIGGGVLVALRLGISDDTRTFSRTLGIEHALVLREVTELAEIGLLRIVDRKQRSQKASFALTDISTALLARTSLGGA